MVMIKIIVKDVRIEEVVSINRTVPEFDPYTREHFEERLKNTDNLVIAAYLDEKSAGYLVGYDRYKDGSFYCWMVGVNPDFRRRGVLKALMSYQERLAREKGYTKIKIKTRNRFIEMLTYLVEYGFYFTEVVPCSNIEDNRILLEKCL